MKKIQTILSIFFLFLLSSWNTTNTSLVSGIVTEAGTGERMPGVWVLLKGSTIGTLTNTDGYYEIEVPSGKGMLVFSYIGFTKLEVSIENQKVIDVQMHPDVQSLSEVVVTGYSVATRKQIISGVAITAPMNAVAYEMEAREPYYPPHNTEGYDAIEDNTFREAKRNPLSTFSIDVDNASYSNMRRFINHGQMPPKDAIRIEEMINYFTYDYPQPAEGEPFSINTEFSACPWNPDHQLVHIGLQGRRIPTENLPASNLVFLIDVSGSMQAQNKLPLLKSAFKLLVNELRPQDHVSIVVYAGAAGVILPATPGSNKKEILDAIEKLEAGGSTAGGAGIQRAYEIAQKHFKKEGNNRVIIATDGDFNVGASSNAEMERLIEEKRKSGVYLTVLGFGMGNYKDAKMEGLADKGNGNYAYIDNILEAKKVLVSEFGGTMFAIAKDVKLQIEFNPTNVKAYRLIGYENRILKDEDFNNDKKDAGDLGAGHSVTAIYEIIPASLESSPFLQTIDDLKYQQADMLEGVAPRQGELLSIKLRYKKPEGSESRLLEKTVLNKALALNQTSDNFRFSAAVASFGMLLRDSEFKGEATYETVLELAKGATGKDPNGYRFEFLNLIKSSQLLANN